MCKRCVRSVDGKRTIFLPESGPEVRLEPLFGDWWLPPIASRLLDDTRHVNPFWESIMRGLGIPSINIDWRA